MVLLSSSSSTTAAAVLRTAGIAYVASLGALVAYNVRWKQVLLHLLGRKKPRQLPATKVEASSAADKKNLVVVLLHGMWHNATYFAQLQQLLAQRGYASLSVDLLPGERILPGGTQTELVADLEVTLAEILPEAAANNNVVLLGHSQGGLLVQGALQTSQSLQKCTKAAILLGTYPLGLPWPMHDLLHNPLGNMFWDIGYLYLCAFGKLMNARYAKHIFLLPNSNLDQQPSKKKYVENLLKAPSDGFLTTTHQMYQLKKSQMPISSTIPTLVLGASHDIIYPPTLLETAFEERFTNITHVVALKQAHCFQDACWAEAMARPLIDWLDEQQPADC